MEESFIRIRVVKTLAVSNQQTKLIYEKNKFKHSCSSNFADYCGISYGW